MNRSTSLVKPLPTRSTCNPVSSRGQRLYCSLDMVNIKQLLLGARPQVRRLGWDLKRYPGLEPGPRRLKMLGARNVDLVVDVGANTGQYGKELRRDGYSGAILSFEPMTDAFTQLEQASVSDVRWTAVRSAVGSKQGDITINVSSNSVSSSALPMLDRHVDAAPTSQYIGSENAPVDRLDVLAASAIESAQHPFLKVDTQGYEAEVLDGAIGLIDVVVGMELEMSLVSLYEGQMLLMETLERMRGYGFRLVGLNTGFVDPRSGETLQADGIFFRD